MYFSLMLVELFYCEKQYFSFRIIVKELTKSKLWNTNTCLCSIVLLSYQILDAVAFMLGHMNACHLRKLHALYEMQTS